MTFSAEEANQTPPAGGTTDTATPPAGGSTDTAAGGGSGLEGIGGADVTAQRRPMRESIYAVQQIYALRVRRLELQPTVGFSLNDPFVSHTGIGISANYWVSNVLAVGANFMFFQPFNSRSEVDFQVARSTRLVVPINEYQLATALNFTYVPVYGKFLMFNSFIFHWDIYLTAGLGLMRTRPIPVVDPEVRSFTFFNSIMFNAGVGVRVFINRWLGIIGEIRNYVYSETLESTRIGTQERTGMLREQDYMNMDLRQNPNTWVGGNALTDNVMVQVGLTVFLPFSFSYRLQR